MSTPSEGDRAVPGQDPRGHMPALDGVRGLAIILVLLVRFVGDESPITAIERGVVKAANYGIWGVDLFFVLSGFLITGILFDQKGKAGYFRTFYARRTLRIVPLYYGVLALLLLVAPNLGPRAALALGDAAQHQAWLWTYTSNVYLAAEDGWVLPYVSHLWSLAVGEHFCLVWPLIVWAFGARALLRISVVASLLALALRCGLSLAGAGGVALVTLTPCRLDALCVGGFLAVAIRSFGLARVGSVARPALVGASLLVLATSLWHAVTYGALRDFVLPLRGTCLAIAFGALLVTTLSLGRRGLGAIFHAPALRFFGKYSYGLYVFHGLIAYLLQEQGFVGLLTAKLGSHSGAILAQATLGTAASLLVSVASYELFEKHFLRLKTRLAPTPAGAQREAIEA